MNHTDSSTASVVVNLAAPSNNGNMLTEYQGHRSRSRRFFVPG